MNKGHTKSYKVILFDNSISVQTLCNSAIFKVIFDTIQFMSALSNYVYIKKRRYQIECRLLRVEIQNTADFMALFFLAEIG